MQDKTSPNKPDKEDMNKELSIAASDSNGKSKEFEISSHAGFLVRLQAQLIDWMLYVIIFITVWLTIFQSQPSIEKLLPSLALVLYIQIFIFPLVQWIYTILFTTKFGGTAGKLLSGIKITFQKERLLTIKESTFRTIVGYFIAGLLNGLGFLWIIRDPENRGWHDQVSGTTVIYSKKSLRFLGTIILIILIAMNAYFISSIIQSIKVNSQLQTEVVEIWEEVTDSLLENDTPPATIQPEDPELII